MSGYNRRCQEGLRIRIHRVEALEDRRLLSFAAGVGEGVLSRPPALLDAVPVLEASPFGASANASEAGSLPPLSVEALSVSEPHTPAAAITATISAADVVDLIGSEFAELVAGNNSLDNSFFDFANPDTLVVMAEARVQDVLDRLTSLEAAGPAANETPIRNGFYYLRAAGYDDFYSSAVTYSSTLKPTFRTSGFGFLRISVPTDRVA